MKTSRGFTLIDTLVYLALFTMVVGGLIVSAYSFFESSGRNISKSVLQNEQNFLLAKINWTLNNVQTISAPAINASGSTLTVSTYSGTNATLTRTGALLTLNGVALNTPDLSVTRFTVIHTYAGGNNPEYIEAGITLSMKTPNGMTIQQSASTTRYIRK